MSESVLIRRARVTDAPAIERVARATWKDTYTGLIPKEVQARILNRAYTEEGLFRAIDRPSSWFFVAEAGGTVVGFAEFAPRSEEKVDLLRIYVLPEHQRAGIGSALLEAGLDAIRRSNENYTRLVAGVEIGNSKAIRFYEKHGFRHVTTTTFDHDDLSTHVYELKI